MGNHFLLETCESRIITNASCRRLTTVGRFLRSRLSLKKLRRHLSTQTKRKWFVWILWLRCDCRWHTREFPENLWWRCVFVISPPPLQGWQACLQWYLCFSVTWLTSVREKVFVKILSQIFNCDDQEMLEDLEQGDIGKTTKKVISGLFHLVTSYS